MKFNLFWNFSCITLNILNKPFAILVFKVHLVANMQYKELVYISIYIIFHSIEVLIWKQYKLFDVTNSFLTPIFNSCKYYAN